MYSIELQTGQPGIPSQALKKMTLLNTVELSENTITSVPDYAFQTLRNLQTLNLGSNAIPDNGLSNNSFSGLSQLTSLSLYGNQLTSIPVSVLRPISFSLQTLSLSGNNISNIPSNTFKNFANLQLLDIAFNPLTSLQPSTFTGIGSKSFTLITSLPTISLDTFAGMPNVQNVILRLSVG